MIFFKNQLVWIIKLSKSLHPSVQSHLCFKVHKHEIIWIFLPKSIPYMPFVNFRKKIRFFSFDFRQNFDVRTFPRWLSSEHTRNQIFLMSYSKIFFVKVLTLVLLDGFLDGFWKFWLFIVKICILIWYFWVFFKNYSMRMLSIRGNDFIARSAYSEPIS